jgi:hypothetical protein
MFPSEIRASVPHTVLVYSPVAVCTSATTLQLPGCTREHGTIEPAGTCVFGRCSFLKGWVEGGGGGTLARLLLCTSQDPSLG